MFSETKVKVVAGVATFIAIALISWATSWVKSNVVLAEDLSGFADMVTNGLREELKPLKDDISAIKQDIQNLSERVDQNTAANMTARIEALNAFIRDLTVEVKEMEEEKVANPSAWRERDQYLLEEWTKDLDDANTELTKLRANLR